MAITLFLDGEPLVGVAFLGVITAGLTLGRPAGKILAIFSLVRKRETYLRRPPGSVVSF